MQAIVLGGTIPHSHLIKLLNTRGYRTILIDYLDNPYAADYADLHIKESTLDYERILGITKELKVDLLIGAAVDRTNIVACYVGEKLGLPIPYSYDIAIHSSRKCLIKQKLTSANIPTAKYAIINKQDIAAPYKITANLQFPLVVKPVDNCSANGISFIDTTAKLIPALKHALIHSRENHVLIEEFIPGIELTVPCFVNQGVGIILNTMQVFTTSHNIRHTAITVEPPIAIKIQLQQILDKLIAVYNLKTTALFFQVKIYNNIVYVLELALRLGGGSSFELIKETTGFDILNAIIDVYLGNSLNVDLVNNNLIALTYYPYTAYSGIYDHITGLQPLEHILSSYYYHYLKGMPFNIHSRVCTCNCIQPTLDAALNNLTLLKQVLRVIDINYSDATYFVPNTIDGLIR